MANGRALSVMLMVENEFDFDSRKADGARTIVRNRRGRAGTEDLYGRSRPAQPALIYGRSQLEGRPQ